MKKTSILPDYDKLLKSLDDANIRLQNLQREKDFKITKIENEYTSKIDVTMRIIDSLNIQLKNAVAYVNQTKK